MAQTNYPNSSPWHLGAFGFTADETPTQMLPHSHRTLHIPPPPGLCPGWAWSPLPPHRPSLGHIPSIFKHQAQCHCLQEAFLHSTPVG